ncbi:MAG: Cobalamin import ATP-binding protein BtuD [Methanosaeta sp. PtaU1.Bin016]|nr:MAG: Cobalamin import ATP-binding protein BtuD [Methanosaeta sp. PtaU1.Bin016]
MSTQSAAGITVEDVTLSYGSSLVLASVSLALRRGEVITLLGPNGCGKTTLLKIINGLLHPSRGRVCINGKEITRMGQAELARLIGYVPQAQRSSFPFSVLDIVLTGRMPHLSVLAQPGEDDVNRSLRALELVGVSHLASRPYTQISGGERQLVMIARALAQEPRYLLLDEPTSYLDFKNQIHVLKMIRGIARSQEMTVVMTLHDPNHALMFSDEIVLLRKLFGLEGMAERQGLPRNLVAVGDPLEVMTPENIKDAYGVDVEVLEVKGRRILLPA